MAGLGMAAMAALSAGMAVADCPDPAAMAGAGIEVLLQDGTVERYAEAKAGVIVLQGGDATEFTYRMDLAHGLYTLSYADLFDGTVDTGTRSTTSYAVGVEALPEPGPGLRWSGETVTFEAGEFYPEVQTWAMGQRETLTFGGCTLPAIEAVAAYAAPDGGLTIEGLLFFPDYGFAALTWFEEDGQRTDYTIVGLRPAGG